MSTEEDFPLPEINPFIELLPAQNQKDGTPRWTVHNPLTNSYYRIEWQEFECLARFHRCRNAAELKDSVNQETTLNIDLKDIRRLCDFLTQHELVVLPVNERKFTPKTSYWSKSLKTYLFFTIPLIKPQRFLNKTVSCARPFMNSVLHKAVLFIFCLLILLTLPQTEAFFSTFPQLLSWEGVFLGLLLFALVKICHEFAHAYTATYYNVPVSHMGIAFIVLYPILYTEATGSWRLQDPKKRMHIGMAGIIAELYIATIFLALWHVSPPGMLQTISFTVVAITFLGSVLINLNPFMRFDGYYILSDWLGYENLQDRSIAFARWKLRGVLFGLSDDPPEDISVSDQRFLTLFGAALLIYRFFLFLGIALLVYALFFKPLGLFLMLVELWWFIGRPILSEIKFWRKRRSELLATKRIKALLIGMAVLFVYAVLPLHSQMRIPAIQVPAAYQTFYAPASAYIEELNITNHKTVKEGDILAVLSSPPLSKELALAEAEKSALQKQRRSLRFTETGGPEILSIEDKLKAVEIKISALEEEQAKLIIRAPFDGVVNDLMSFIHKGRNVPSDEMLFRITKQDKYKYLGYVSEQQQARITEGQQAVYQPPNQLGGRQFLTVSDIQPTAVEVMEWPELASSYGGPIATDRIKNENTLKPRQSYYQVVLNITEPSKNGSSKYIQPGTVFVQTQPVSLFLQMSQNIITLLQRELSLNN